VIGRRSALESFLGAILLAGGLGLLSEVGYYLFTHYHLFTQGRMEEPANPGKTPNPSSRGLFTGPFEEMTQEERDRKIRQELADLREQGRRDALLARIQLYAVGPTGLLLAVVGVWLLTAGPRKQSR
jgi:hypothetical protein